MKEEASWVTMPMCERSDFSLILRSRDRRRARPPGWVVETRYQRGQRRLARARRPHERDALAGRDVEIDVLEAGSVRPPYENETSSKVMAPFVSSCGSCRGVSISGSRSSTARNRYRNRIRSHDVDVHAGQIGGRRIELLLGSATKATTVPSLDLPR